MALTALPCARGRLRRWLQAVKRTEEDRHVANLVGVVELDDVEALSGLIADRDVKENQGALTFDDLAGALENSSGSFIASPLVNFDLDDSADGTVVERDALLKVTTR